MMAIDDANAKGGAGGYKLKVTVLDSGTATAGQYDPAQAATNAKKFVADPERGRHRRPEMSGEGKAMTPILSAANLATVTPSSTNPDITDPKFAGQYKPGGKAIYFRTVTTDAYQGPNMANYMRDTLKVKSVYILDDSGAYGVGMSNLYEAQAKKIGMNVMGHDQLDPKEADYTTIITKIKAAQSRRHLLRRRRPGRGQGRQAVLRHLPDRHQGRRRRHGGWRHPLGRRLPGDRRLVCDPGFAPRHGRSRDDRLGRALHQDLQHDAERLRDHGL